MTFGTYTSDQSLRVSQASVIQSGEQNVYQSVVTLLNAHNTQVDETMSIFVEKTTQRKRLYGGPGSMSMQRMDEIGTPSAQRILMGSNVEFPLWDDAIGLQWTRQYLMKATPEEVLSKTQAAMTADLVNLQTELKKAFFLPTNYSWIDRLDDHSSLSVKRLVNADGAQIPTAPDGSNFDGSTHTHYLATASFINTNLKALIRTVNEHFLRGRVLVCINEQEEATVSGFTGFYPVQPANIMVGNGNTVAVGALDVQNTSNRRIGVFNGVDIWTKPWVPAGYVIAVHVDAPEKPLVMRVDTAGSGGLELDFEYEEHPLMAKGFRRRFGFGVFNRVAAAVLYTGGGSYVAPTL